MNAPNAVIAGQNEYVRSLAAAWEAAQAPREPDAPTVLSTFAGCGGSSLGYAMAGYRELLAVEWDDHAVATFKLNFPDVPVFHDDIKELSVETCMRQAGLSGPGELDVLDGSPPCQGFSTAGKRDFGDDRNDLFREYVRLLRGLRPKAFIMENVSGMVKGKMKLIFAECMRELKASGYRVKAALLNAKWFGVPQSRQRIIIIGSGTHDVTCPRFTSERCYCVEDAIGDLAGLPTDKPFNPDTRMARVMLSVLPGHCDPKHYSHVKLRWDQPARTLQHDFLSYFHVWHPSAKRPLRLDEWKRLGSFPEAVLFSDKPKGCSEIGNSVPPLFMRAIAQHVRDTLLQARTESGKTIEAFA